MLEWRFGLALQFGDNALGKHLPQFNSPLVKRVNAPDGPLHKHAVFVQCDEPSQRRWGQPL